MRASWWHVEGRLLFVVMCVCLTRLLARAFSALGCPFGTALSPSLWHKWGRRGRFGDTAPSEDRGCCPNSSAARGKDGQGRLSLSFSPRRVCDIPPGSSGARNGSAAAALPGKGKRWGGASPFAFPRPCEGKMAAPSPLLAWCVQHLRGDFGLDVGEEVVR